MSAQRKANRDLATSRSFPAAFDQLLGLHKLVEDAAVEAGLDRKLVELVKIRASQLNGWASRSAGCSCCPAGGRRRCSTTPNGPRWR